MFTASILLTPSLALQIPDAWKSLEEDPSVTDATSRVIYTGQGAGNVQSPFCGNEIHTAKYNTASFVPIFLFTMFSRVAYLYFLTQVNLSTPSTMRWFQSCHCSNLFSLSPAQLDFSAVYAVCAGLLEHHLAILTVSLFFSVCLHMLFPWIQVTSCSGSCVTHSALTRRKFWRITGFSVSVGGHPCL